VTNSKIFISHRSNDKDVADMLLDFFAITSLPIDDVFCSSLPGNDIKSKISEEIKQALKTSAVNLVILSEEYYNSAYCLNEEGIIWFHDTPVIIIALPEINSNNMLGFLNNEYKLRRLDNIHDIAAIYEQISNVLHTKLTSTSKVTIAMNKLQTRYCEYIKTRSQLSLNIVPSKIESLDELTTDDEKLILYYIISHKVRKVTDEEIKNWMAEKELYEINIANGFDLLASAGWGTLSMNVATSVFELEISRFRTLLKTTDDSIKTLGETSMKHCHLSKEQFITMWHSKQFDDSELLFISYIYDENIFSLGSRWMEKDQVESIKQWEQKYSLEKVLSKNYGKCLAKFIENNLVFESSWTSYGNPREYTLHKSLNAFFMSKEFPYSSALEEIKAKYYFDIPF